MSYAVALGGLEDPFCVCSGLGLLLKKLLEYNVPKTITCGMIWNQDSENLQYMKAIKRFRIDAYCSY